ncbi:MAG: histidine kinase [Alphaproteobacteria bacterium]|uniref:histidine kinase n=1 Tax=Candidatus Nitrobium versatile TaxID=2884831 RepID=A0A953JD11_9BACT|nr:histidine kinase [Candidatus Nitrobium versatile]
MEHEASRERIDFSLGADLCLRDILRGPDVLPLLKSLVKSGAAYAAIIDERGNVLWKEGEEAALHCGAPGTEKAMERFLRREIRHEGEPVGFLCLAASREEESAALSGLLETASVCLDLLIKNIVKRVFTTELHSTVVKRSYEELLEINKALSASERKYRELSGDLERQVEERTAELKRAHTRLLQQEKMASVGQLAAGIAHEINNPIGFVYSNLNTFGKYIRNLREMLLHYRKNAGTDGEAEELYRKLKIDFILEDTDALIRQSREGAERIRQIVAHLKGFSHVDEMGERAIQVNEELDTVLNVLSHEIRERQADISRSYGDLPPVFGNPGILGQALFNIILNALQSKEKEVSLDIGTEHSGGNIVVSVEDNGQGMPAEIQGRIFEPFFTTKEVGKGTGMGLAVAYDVVTSWGGTIEVKSEPGKGSRFTITLPSRGARRTGEA